ncbi:UNVERIFIED_CONTAM: hypothetical protein RMT77_000639 [Armadillidium vulgare]
MEEVVENSYDDSSSRVSVVVADEGESEKSTENHSIATENGGGGEGEILDEQDSILLIEKRSFRPFKTAEDYLYAMREDLAEWLNGLYDLDIDVDNFFELLENGVLLCEHSNNVKAAAEEFIQKISTPSKKFSSRYEIPSYEVHYKKDSAPGSFFARDNVHNFIRWCRDLGVHDVLMFETDDLVLRKNEKHVILALLEIARRGARFGMPAPLLVQMEDDIDREIEKDRRALEENERRVLIGQEESEIAWDERTHMDNERPPNLIYGPQPQVITNDLLSLDEMVRDLVGRCTCPTQFPMVKVSEGKYRIGDTKVLIFVRILRNHVMVRVGGGWDTLHHYLDKHDPCRCRSGHKPTISAKIGFKTHNDGDRHLSSVSYERSMDGYTLSPSPRRRMKGQRNSLENTNSLRQRSQSPALARDNSPNSNLRFSDQIKPRERNKSDASEHSIDSNSEFNSSRKLNQTKCTPSGTKTSLLSPKNVSTKKKSPSFENLTRRTKHKSPMDFSRRPSNVNPRTRNDSSRKFGTSDTLDSQKISRSDSTVSDGGLEYMFQKEGGTRQPPRLGNGRIHAPIKSSRTAWNGCNGRNSYSSASSEINRPPRGTRSTRSASASPAMSRKSFTSSEPSTPGNGSPKRPSLGPFAPVVPSDILHKLPNVTGDNDAEILAQLEGFVNNYRAYVVEKLTSEGKSIPADLALPERENDESSRKNSKFGSLRATPRKDGVGSRIPAPVF